MIRYDHIHNLIHKFVIITAVLTAMIIIGGIYTGFVTQEDNNNFDNDTKIEDHNLQINRDIRISSDVLNEFENNQEVRLIVRLKEIEGGSDKEDKKEKIKENQERVINELSQENKLKHQFKSLNSIAVESTLEGLEELSQIYNIEEIILDNQKFAFLNETIPLINADDVWNLEINGQTLTGKGQTVCIIDTGIDYTNPVLGGCIGEGCKVLGGFDYIENDTDPMDDNGHGTFCAGVIASMDSIYRGVAPDTNLIAIKSLDSAGGGYDSDIISGIEWCTENATTYNISVISMSLGAPCPGGCFSDYCDDSQIEFRNAIDNAVAKNITVVIASGNEGATNKISSPACIQNATSVGSSTKQDEISDFSNRAAILDLVAPGTRVTSLDLDGFLIGNGTSISAPHVSGLVSLMYQKEKLINDRQLNSDRLKSKLKNTGVTISDPASGYSFKRINAYEAIQSILLINDTDDSAENIHGKIKFVTSTDLSKISNAFIITPNFISLDTSAYPEYDKPAELRLFNLGYQKTPVILKDGSICSPPLCNTISYLSGNLAFSVEGFSNYSAGINSELEIWNSAESVEIGPGENISFYANYTNISSGNAISTGVCDISFEDFNDSMEYDSSNGVYNYTRTFSITGLVNYFINCSDSNFESLNASDYLTISCTYPGANIPWVVQGEEYVVCDSQKMYLDNNTLTIKDNATLILINSTLMKIDGGTSNISILGNAILIANDSWIGSNNTNFNVGSSSRIEFDNVTLNKSAPYIYSGNSILRNSRFVNNINFLGDSNNLVINSNFSSQVEINADSINRFNNSRFTGLANTKGDSINTFNDCSFTDRLYLYENSNTTISNTNIGQCGMFRITGNTPKVNFIAPISNITTSILYSTGVGGLATIRGEINMPSSGSISIDGEVLRYYPVYVYYNGTNISYENREVNITDSNGNLIWQGATNSQGYIEANLTLNSSNYGYGNFTISTNSSSDITLLTDTPIILEATGTPPSNSSEEESGSRTCRENWNCTEWSECFSQGFQTRTCTDLNNCRTELKKPNETQDCLFYNTGGKNGKFVVQENTEENNLENNLEIKTENSKTSCCLFGICWFKYIICWYWWFIIILIIIVLVQKIQKRKRKRPRIWLSIDL